MSQAKAALLMMKGSVSDMEPQDQAAVKAALEDLRAARVAADAKHGEDHTSIALGLFTLEIAVENE